MLKNFEEIEIIDSKFTHKGDTYDCNSAIKRDMALIIQEAEKSHKDTFDDTYDRYTLRPEKARVYTLFDRPVYCIISYLINYKDSNYGRYALGEYYPIQPKGEAGHFFVCPHPYNGSICW